MIKRLFPVILARQPARLRDFYRDLLGLEVRYDNEWYIHLACPADPRLELGIHRRDHEGLPASLRDLPHGAAYLSVLVDNVDACSRKARAMGAEVLDRPDKPGTDHYDRLRLLLRDPEGCLLELVTPTDPREAVMSELTFDQ